MDVIELSNIALILDGGTSICRSDNRLLALIVRNDRRAWQNIALQVHVSRMLQVVAHVSLRPDHRGAVIRRGGIGALLREFECRRTRIILGSFYRSPGLIEFLLGIANVVESLARRIGFRVCIILYADDVSLGIANWLQSGLAEL